MLALVLSLAFVAPAAAQVYSEVIVFGDSSVDSGYYRAFPDPGGGATYNGLWPAAVDAGAGTPTSRPGLMNSEHLANYFGITLRPSNVSGGTNYATSGAKIVDENTSTNGGFRRAIPVATQISNFLASRGGVASPTALYYISAGGNDVSFARGTSGSGPYPTDPTAYVQSRGVSLANAIGTLKMAGGQTFVVGTLNQSFPSNDSTVRELRAAFNTAVANRLSQLSVSVITASFNETRLAISANPGSFGLSNVGSGVGNTSCVNPSGVTTAWGLLCSSAAGAPSSLATPTADMVRLFADDSHYSTHGQKIQANYIYGLLPAATSSPLVASILPTSRSVQVGQSATAFVTILNSSNTAATGCRISPVTNVFARFSYQTTNASNQLTGTPNTPVSIPAGGSQSFVIAFSPATFAMPSQDVRFTFVCQNRASVVALTGINTLQLTFDNNPVPDLIMIGASPSNDGFVRTNGPAGTGFFVASAVNIGAAASLTARVRKLNTSMPANVTVCQTNANTGACLATPAPTVTVSIATNQVTTWAVFVTATGTIAPDPATNRLFLEFTDAANVVRGSTSIAATTQGGGS